MPLFVHGISDSDPRLEIRGSQGFRKGNEGIGEMCVNPTWSFGDEITGKYGVLLDLTFVTYCKSTQLFLGKLDFRFVVPISFPDPNSHLR
jgi:hypothetical protein